jgi:hypothetical protein
VTQLVARVGVASFLSVAVAVGAVYIVKAIDQLGDTASSNSSLEYDDREIAGGNSIIVDQTAAYEARRLIPVTASYRFASGGGLRAKTDLTETFAEGWFLYFMMPRRQRADARWVICYGCDTTNLGGAFEVRWKDRLGISIGRLP